MHFDFVMGSARFYNGLLSKYKVEELFYDVWILSGG